MESDLSAALLDRTDEVLASWSHRFDRSAMRVPVLGRALLLLGVPWLLILVRKVVGGSEVGGKVGSLFKVPP